MEVDWIQHQFEGYARDSRLILRRLQCTGEHGLLAKQALELLRTYLAIPPEITRHPQVDQQLVELAQILYIYIQTYGFGHDICLLWPQLRRIAKALPDPTSYVQITKQLAVVKNDRGEVTEAQALYEELIQTPGFGQWLPDQQADVLHQAAVCFYRQGNYLQAQRLAAACIDLPDAWDDRTDFPERQATPKSTYALRVHVATPPVWESQAYAHHQLGNLALVQGNFAKAWCSYEQSLNLFIKHGEEDNLACVAYQSLGYLLVIRRRFADAVPLLEKNLSIRKHRGEKGGGAFAAIYLATAYLGLGRSTEAETLLNDAMAVCSDLQDWRGMALCHLYFGYLEHRYQHNRSAALAQWQQAQVVASSIPVPAIELQALAVLMTQFLSRGHLRQLKVVLIRLYANLRQQGLGPVAAGRLLFHYLCW